MADLEARLNETFQEIAADISKSLEERGDLSQLSTNTKVSLVAAVNEIAANSPVGALLSSADLSDVSNPATARTNLSVNSSAETTSAIGTAVASVTLASLGGIDQAALDQAISDLVGSAPAALNTLQEIATELANDDNAFAALTATVSNKVGFASAQALTQAQKLQACQNIGIGNPDFDFKSAYIATRDA